MALSKLQDAFQASLESEELDDDALLEGGEDSMEAELIAVQEAADEAEEAAEIAEELDEVAEGLESIFDHMEATMEDGGLEPGAAAALNLAVEAHTRRLGVTQPLMASMESFGGQSDRASATTISMEAVGDTIKKVWLAIKSAIQRAIKAITDFFAKIFGGVDKIIKRADDLASMSKELGKKKAASGKVKASGLSRLHVGGKYSANDIVGGLKTMDTLAGKLFGDYVKSAVGYYDGIVKFVGSENEVKVEHSKSAVKDIERSIKGLVREEFSGGRVFRTAKPDDNDPEDKLRLPVLAVANDKLKVTETVEIDVLTEGQIEAVLKAVRATAVQIKGKKVAVDDLNRARQNAVKAGDKFAEASDRGILGRTWDRAQIRRAMRAIQADTSRPIVQFTSHSFSAMRAALALVERSIKAYE